MRDGEVIEREKSFWQAMQDRDGATAAALNDDTCIVVGSHGVGELTREQLGPMIEKAPYTLNKFAIDGGTVHVREVSDDLVIAAYTVHEKMTVDGKRVELDAHDASVWVRKDGGWVCVLHTESIGGDPFGRDRRVTPKRTAKRTRKPAAKRARTKVTRKRARG